LQDKIDREHEKKVAKQKLEVRPEEVSTESSRRHLFEQASETGGKTHDTTQELKQDIVSFDRSP
jgi:hypothetical protein